MAASRPIHFRKKMKMLAFEVADGSKYSLEATGDEIDEDWIAVFQNAGQVLGSGLPLTSFAVGDAARIAFGICGIRSGRTAA